jgi:catechol 2,3-dioxygenase-like lactoylglutathione lyase family enzyme
VIQSVNATVFVSDMDRAVDFYTKVLGLPLSGRWGDEWASIDLGKGAAIGLHPARNPQGPKPGTHGSIQIGLLIEGSIDEAVADLKSKGVAFRGPIVDDVAVRIAFFGDPDGNDLYLCEVKKWG